IVRFLTLLCQVAFLIMYRWFILILLHFWMKVLAINLQSERHKVNVFSQNGHREGNPFVLCGFKREDFVSGIDLNLLLRSHPSKYVQKQIKSSKQKVGAEK